MLTQLATWWHYFSSNQEVLLSLLKSFLPIPEDVDEVEIMNKEKIQQSEELILLDTSISPDAPDKKGVIFDLRVKLPNGETALIEMQNYWQPFREERTIQEFAVLQSAGFLHLRARSG